MSAYYLYILILFDLIHCVANAQFVTKNGPPRFKQSVRKHQYTYLGDTAKFKCDAVGRPLPKVHWFRDGVYMNFSFMQERPRLQEKGMELEIRRVEVDDKGHWSCKVWNNEGSIMRNFTLHIIDYCDFYLTSEAAAAKLLTSEACLCEWLSTDEPAFDDEEDFLDFRDRYCSEYEKENEVTKFRTTAQLLPCRSANCESEDEYRGLLEDGGHRQRSAVNSNGVRPDLPFYSHLHAATPLDPVRLFDELHRTGHPDITHVMPGLLTAAEMLSLRHQLRNSWSLDLDTEDKLERARQILKQRIPVLEAEHEVAASDGDDLTDEDEDEEEDDDEETAEANEVQQNTPTVPPPPPRGHGDPRQAINVMRRAEETTTSTTTTRKWNPIWTTRSWRPPAIPSKVPPYFRKVEEDSTVVIPSGRTLRLNCKAGGVPEPQVIWRKDHLEIGGESERRVGSVYRLRKWSLEIEDASEADSGHYSCDVFNTVGSVRRDFRVDVRDRLRSRPIILPHILFNQTVNANQTANFTCQVLSDLDPHVVWIHLVSVNGSYIRWDESQSRNVFNFVDMSTVKKARLLHDNQSKMYTLLITNVSVDDQGIYSCVAGNTLGISMANATLTVHEYRGMTLPTDSPYPPWPLSFILLLILVGSLIISVIIMAFVYFCYGNNPHKRRIRQLIVRKKVVITKKPPRDGEVWSDLASSYTITVEPIVDKSVKPKRANARSDTSVVSEYEVPTDVAWEIERERLSMREIIGEGAFGEVWRGVLQMNRHAPSDARDAESVRFPQNHPFFQIPVAVKKLKPTAQEKELIILVSEMQIFKSIGKHKNILKLIGCCTGTGPLLVVLELCPHGNLRDFLRKHRPQNGEFDEYPQDNYFPPQSPNSSSSAPTPKTTIRNLTLRDLIRFAIEIANGMQFLADKKIIHRDLAARNILVAEDLSMKISDFGLSRNIFCQDYYRKRGAGRLPIKWMAPEALEASVYTIFSDIWSFGIVLWEIMTLGGTPYPSIAMPQLYNLLKEGYRMEAPHNCPDEIYSVMVMCWHERPESRPLFQTVSEYLEWIVREAMKMNPSGVVDDYLDTEIGKIEDRNHRRPSRPLSAPGLMSIQSFAREMADSIRRQRQHESTPLLNQYSYDDEEHPKPRRAPSMEWDGMVELTTLEGTPLQSAAASPNSATAAAETPKSPQSEAAEPSPPFPYANVHDYVNKSGGHVGANDEFVGSYTPVGKRRHPLQRVDRLAESNGDIPMVAVVRPEPLIASPIPHSKSTLNGRGKRSGAATAIDETQRLMPRSHSVDSQSSSGHGGSSAMSSAEGLGGIGEFCQIVTDAATPRGSSRDVGQR